MTTTMLTMTILIIIQYNIIIILIIMIIINLTVIPMTIIQRFIGKIKGAITVDNDILLSFFFPHFFRLNRGGRGVGGWVFMCVAGQ